MDLFTKLLARAQARAIVDIIRSARPAELGLDGVDETAAELKTRLETVGLVLSEETLWAGLAPMVLLMQVFSAAGDAAAVSAVGLVGQVYVDWLDGKLPIVPDEALRGLGGE